MKGGNSMYLTYAEYQNMGGTEEETAFNNLEFEARSYIDWYTFNRLQNETENTLPDEVKQLMFFLINLIIQRRKNFNIGSNGIAKSPREVGNYSTESNDGVSISYGSLNANGLIEKSDAEINSAIQRYLQGVVNSLGHKLLYRGLYPGE